MPLARKLYRGCKVWAEVDEQGRLVERRGLVPIRYRQDAAESYSARASEIADLAPAPLGESEAKAGEAEAKAAAPRMRAARAARPRAARSAAGARTRGARAAAGAKTAAKAGGPEPVIIYADGACFGNPGPAGAGVLLEWKGHVKEVSEFLGAGTNNIAELTAIETALKLVKNRRLPVRLHTDSAYSIGVLSEGWKAKFNQQLIARIQALMREFSDLQLVKVRGHAGDPRNERVDQLARDAILRNA